MRARLVSVFSIALCSLNATVNANTALEDGLSPLDRRFADVADVEIGQFCAQIDAARRPSTVLTTTSTTSISWTTTTSTFTLTYTSTEQTETTVTTTTSTSVSTTVDVTMTSVTGTSVYSTDVVTTLLTAAATTTTVTPEAQTPPLAKRTVGSLHGSYLEKRYRMDRREVGDLYPNAPEALLSRGLSDALAVCEAQAAADQPTPCQTMMVTSVPPPLHCGVQGTLKHPSILLTYVYTGTGSGFTACLNSCLHTKGCRSFAFNNDTAECDLYNKKLDAQGIQHPTTTDAMVLYNKRCFTVSCPVITSTVTHIVVITIIDNAISYVSTTVPGDTTTTTSTLTDVTETTTTTTTTSATTLGSVTTTTTTEIVPGPTVTTTV